MLKNRVYLGFPRAGPRILIKGSGRRVIQSRLRLIRFCLIYTTDYDWGSKWLIVLHDFTEISGYYYNMSHTRVLSVS